MNCPKCNYPLEADDLFCPECGAKLDAVSVPLPAPVLAEKPPTPAAKSKKKPALKKILAIVLAAVAVCGAVAAIILHPWSTLLQINDATGDATATPMMTLAERQHMGEVGEVDLVNIENDRTFHVNWDFHYSAEIDTSVGESDEVGVRIRYSGTCTEQNTTRDSNDFGWYAAITFYPVYLLDEGVGLRGNFPGTVTIGAQKYKCFSTGGIYPKAWEIIKPGNSKSITLQSTDAGQDGFMEEVLVYISKHDANALLKPQGWIMGGAGISGSYWRTSGNIALVDLPDIFYVSDSLR